MKMLLEGGWMQEEKEENALKDQKRMTRRLAGMLRARLPEIGLEKVPDQRPDDKRKKWPLPSMLRSVLAAMSGGARSCAEAESMTTEMSPNARRILGIERRMPDTTLRSAMIKIEPEELRRCLRRQTKSAHRRKALEPERLPFGVVAMDGKYTAIEAWDEKYSQRQSESAGGAHGTVRTFTCSLVSSRAKPCIDAAPIPSATNEMGYFGEVFADLMSAYGQSDLFRVVTADAGSCSNENGQTVVDAGRDYLFGLKGGQKTLLTEARALLARRTPAEADAETVDICKPFEVRRRLYMTASMEGYEWSHLRTVLRVETERRVIETGEIVAQEVDDVNRYYVSSLSIGALGADRWLLLVRLHWGVENDCHNTWDTAFAEDDRPWVKMNPQGAVVVMLLRRIAYNMLALYRAVTQRAEENRRTPWKTLQRWVRDMLVTLNDNDLAGLRERKADKAFA